MTDPQPTHWWNRGDMCEVCGIEYCSPHKPKQSDNDDPETVGPYGITGLEKEMVGPIEVFFLDHHKRLGVRTPVGWAVYRGKSYDESKFGFVKYGSLDHARSIASVAAMWVGRSVGSGYLPQLTAVVAVPAKPGREGISLPKIVAEHIAAELDVPVVTPLQWLSGVPQVKATDKDGRQSALDPHIEILSPAPAGTLLLVDDILETGATISVVERKLRKAGASKVIAFALSKAHVSEKRSFKHL